LNAPTATAPHGAEDDSAAHDPRAQSPHAGEGFAQAAQREQDPIIAAAMVSPTAGKLLLVLPQNGRGRFQTNADGATLVNKRYTPRHFV
jgi:hypothetical protein